MQVIATILGVDLENPHDVASINGASAALTVSGIPFNGPIGAVRLAHHEGEWIAHPTFQEGDESTFEIVVAGRKLDDGDVAIMMVEAGGTEHSWELYEAGRTEGHRRGDRRRPRRVEAWIAASIDLQTRLREDVREGARPDRDDRVPARRSTTRPRSTTRCKHHAEARDGRGDEDRRQDTSATRASTRSKRRLLVALVGTVDDARPATPKRRPR